MKNRILIILGLVVFSAVILLPPIIHGYVYPNIGDDTAAHMNLMDYIGIFAPEDIIGEQIRYGALYIIGYPLDFLSHIFNVDNDMLFLWFNFIALLGMGLTLFFIFKSLIGLYAGLLALVIPIFTSYSILQLFYSGVIFEIINLGIILPLAVYCTIKWLITKKKRFAFGAIGLSLLFAVFHSTGVYLPFMAIAGIFAFIVYKLVNKQTISRRGLLGVGVVCIGITVVILLSPIRINLIQAMAVPSIGISGLALLQKSFFYYLSYYVLVILIVSGGLLIVKYKLILPYEKLTVLIFSILGAVMLPAILFGLSPQPFRQGIDLAIFLSLLAVALLGILIRLDVYRMLTFALVGLAISGAFFNINGWFGYNSALEKVDIEAIHYINSLSGESYSSSDNVDLWIYSRFIEKQYLPSGGDIVVVRNVPMRSKVKLVGDGDLTKDKVLVCSFVEGEVEIIIYK
ncbi:hypothetical protein LCGC14_0341180 [marine sediment metagenome]|uniref:Glycosyltransferase RgtA/B/C/D-like domain-containing protein n=1 Tax=marine sediment metagenome TaxID=412755 RepID=A0A0F9W105_9ZZZZ